MKTLIVEDEFTSRLILLELLQTYGPCHIAVNGREAIQAVRAALDSGEPYDLICLDIMMPEMDGHQALRSIRALEESKVPPPHPRTKIVMTTLWSDKGSVIEAARGKCDSFLVKPIERAKLVETLQRLELIS